MFTWVYITQLIASPRTSACDNAENASMDAGRSQHRAGLALDKKHNSLLYAQCPLITNIQFSLQYKCNDLVPGRSRSNRPALDFIFSYWMKTIQ